MFENVFEKCHSVLLLQIRPYDNQKALLDHYFSSKTVAVGGKKKLYSKCQPYIYSILIFAVIITFEIKWCKTFFLMQESTMIILLFLILRQFNHLTRKITLTEINDYFFIKNDSCQILPWNSQCAFQGRFRFKKKLNEGTSIILKKKIFSSLRVIKDRGLE